MEPEGDTLREDVKALHADVEEGDGTDLHDLLETIISRLDMMLGLPRELQNVMEDTAIRAHQLATGDGVPITPC